MATIAHLLLLPVLPAFQEAAGPAQGQEEAPLLAEYRVLDNIEGPHVDLGVAPVRPLAMDLASDSLFALNTHDSRLCEFDLASGELRRSAPLPWGPTAVAIVPQGTPGDLVVVCRGTHALLRLSRATLEVTAVVPLPHEPADLVIPSSNGRAFVSCSGAGQVVEVDFFEGQVVERYPIDAVEPMFMAVRWVDGEPNILVAPRASGNNSMAQTGQFLLLPGNGRVLDLDDPNVASQGLPDHDLFAIVPGSAAVPVARDMGAVLFALGVQPGTGTIWQLGTEAINKDPERQSEPAVRGIFVENQVAMATLAAPGGALVRPRRIIKLDDSDPGTEGIQYDPSRTVGQPCALAFDDSGRGYIAGLLTDNVTVLSPTGTFLREWDVGNIPRALLVDGPGERVWVHCWGSNTVESWDLTQDPPQRIAEMDLGFDPTPAQRQWGRRTFFSAAHSMHNNVSCNSCHVDGGSDFLPWDLSDMPYDDKGPLVTQTLVGIEDLAPYHWRGERGDLIAFNKAFDGLLGGTPLDEVEGGAFDAFQAYVFSLQQPANPNQDARRLLNASLGFDTPDGVHKNGNAVDGQPVYFDKTSDGIASCNGCHTMPTGTNNDVVLDSPNAPLPRRNHKVVASYNGLWRKEPPTLETVVLANGDTELRPTLGAAISSAGLKDSLEDFVNISLFTLTAQERLDVTAFVDQADSGLAPAVHGAWLLDADSIGKIGNQLDQYLLPQAERRNCDVAVLGTLGSDSGQGAQRLRWFWERDSQAFQAEDSSLPPMTLDDFLIEAASDRGHFVFIGLPVGMAERFAVDYDEDELFNADEHAAGTDPYNPDSDGDGDPDGHEVRHGGDPLDPDVTGDDERAPTIDNVRLVFVTTRVAKILFETDEAAKFQAHWAGGADSGIVTSGRYEKTHSLLLRELEANTDYTVDLTAIDPAGNRRSIVAPQFRTLQFVFPNDVVFDEGDVNVLQDSGGTLEFELTGIVRRKRGTPRAGIQLRVDVYVNDVLVQPNLLGTTSDGTGAVQVTVNRDGLSPGDIVTANLRALFSQVGGQLFWSMPDNDPEFLRFDVVYTGP